jgi:outer membrane protein assembly factor BamB
MLGIKVVNGETIHGEIFDGYYYRDGKPAPDGLIEYEGYYYFADVGGKIATGEKYVWRPNGLMAQDTYIFDTNGRMYGIKVVDGKLISGEIVETQDGFYYYKSGKANAAGLVVVDGYYYFAGVNGKLSIGESYVWKTNGLLAENTYLFGSDGAMLGIKVVDGKVVAGEIMEYNGALHYIKSGRGQAAGLLFIDGYYYFAGADGKLVTNKDFYVWEANGLLVEQVYTFDAQGRITR